jgi:hypothetical protein
MGFRQTHDMWLTLNAQMHLPISSQILSIAIPKPSAIKLPEIATSVLDIIHHMTAGEECNPISNVRRHARQERRRETAIEYDGNEEIQNQNCDGDVEERSRHKDLSLKCHPPCWYLLAGCCGR